MKLSRDGGSELSDDELREMLRRLNLSHLLLTNKTTRSGTLALPALRCDLKVLPDYLALYGDPGEYHMTPLTCVCFHEYDRDFDGQNGLWAAIYYDNRRQLAAYRRRFDGVRLFVSPDYSQVGDVEPVESAYRLFRSRVVSLWLTTELGAAVIPLVSFSTPESVEVALDGLEECEVVAFSTKGRMRDPSERDALAHAAHRTVERLPRLRAIVVYDCCGEDRGAEELFACATARGVEVVIPPNRLKRRNAALRQRRLARSEGARPRGRKG